MSTTLKSLPKPVNYRVRRNSCVVGMFACVALTNIVTIWAASVGAAVLCGLAGIGLFIAACCFYARMRGRSGWVGFAGAMVGLLVWLGISLYLLWPYIQARLQGMDGPDWDEHAPFALWAGFAVGGLLLKSLPSRPVAPVIAESSEKA